MTTLETDRLRLRMFTAEDLDVVQELFSAPEVTQYLNLDTPFSRIDAYRHIALILGSWQLRGYGLWAVESKSTGELIGRIGFIHPIDWPGIELGWVLAPPHWGNGYATEAARACLDHGFSEYGFDHIISLIHPDNHRSIAVAERLGEQVEGTVELHGKEVLQYGIRRTSV